MSNFRVVPNLGSYRVTNHDYRLIFQVSTSVFGTERTLNPMNSLSLVDSSIIWKHKSDCDFLAGQLCGIVFFFCFEHIFVEYFFLIVDLN